MRVRTVLLATALALACARGVPVLACSCLSIAADPSAPRASKAELRRLFEEMQKTSEFFVGTVVATEHISSPRPDASGDELFAVATLEVEELWFGEHAWRKEVYTSAHSTACGVVFEVGQKYIVSGDLIGHSQMRTYEFPQAASWTDSCRSQPYTPDRYQEETKSFKEYATPWRPRAKRISLEP